MTEYEKMQAAFERDMERVAGGKNQRKWEVAHRFNVGNDYLDCKVLPDKSKK